MISVWLRTSIWHNKLRLIYLISLLPIITISVIFIYLYLLNNGNFSKTFWEQFYSISWIWLIFVFIRMIIGIFLQRQIIFAFTGAREITRKQNPKIYNIIENLCISRWIPTPKIWIIDDNSLNAFATWWNKEYSRIVFSQWILDKLNKQEIEAVAGHELTHIINWDVKNMVIINIFIWAISTIWYYMMRMWWRNDKWKNFLTILWLILYIISLTLFPLINLAISRKKEYIADAWSVTLTHNSNSMINALTKISNDPFIEKIDTKPNSIASMFIINPKKESKFLANLKEKFSTHPSIENRIKKLKEY